MGLIEDAIHYIRANPDEFRQAVQTHLRLSVVALLVAMAIFIPLGVLASRTARTGSAVVSAVAAVRVVPSLAIIFLLYPIFGVGDKPALIALTVLAGPPLLINTDAGLRNVDAAVLENARGLGMNPFQVFVRVQLPLALPVLIAGVRTAAVEVIASATLAAFIGAGGLGTYITSGLTLSDYRLLLVGAIPVAVIALLAETMLGGLERLVTPPRAA